MVCVANADGDRTPQSDAQPHTSHQFTPVYFDSHAAASSIPLLTPLKLLVDIRPPEL
jgi:hypothetical protein